MKHETKAKELTTNHRQKKGVEVLLHNAFGVDDSFVNRKSLVLALF